MSPADFYVQKILPARDSNGNVPIDLAFKYLEYGVTLSTTPGPHMAIGVDMIAKCTSPLRRFADLLLHWQVGATLLEEARTGQSLIGNAREDFLPFSKAQIDGILPRLQHREQVIKRLQQDSERHWLCYFILRAWKFGESDIPAVLPFKARHVDLKKGTINGLLTTFLSQASCDAKDLADLQDIKDRDYLEVELTNVDIYSRKIEVKALRRLDS
jgi:exoribonuclease R